VGGEKLAWHGRYHAHGSDEYEFHYFIEGNGAFLANRARHALEPGILMLSRPREFHSILPEAVSRPITYYAVLFEPEPGSAADAEALRLLERPADAAAGENGRQPSGPAPGAPRALEPRDRFLFEELHRLSRLEDEGGRRAASYQLLSLIHRWYGHRKTEIPGERSRGDRTERALAFMATSLRDKLGMDELAARLDLSEEHFIRVFHAELGMTPFQYYTRLKVEAASGLLTGTRMAVNSISEHFGFENPFHFSRVFRKCTGLSPTEYRRTYSQG
jgi:AraC-like DNA-binding protein